jgi:hypothetical protein
MRYSLFRVLLLAAIVGSALALPAMAAVPPQTVQQFLNKPSDLLGQYPSGGPEMIQAVQDFLASDPRTLTAVLSLLPQANPAQSTAIGTALGKYALSVLATDQPRAVQIQDAVVESNNVVAMGAFDAVVGGNIKLTAATTGVGGGAETSTSPGGAGFSVGGGGFGSLPTVGNTPDVFSTTFAGGPAGSCTSNCGPTPVSGSSP